MNKTINQPKVKKDNLVYNQYLVYALVIGALSIPFLFPIKSTNSKKHSTHARKISSTYSSPSLVLPETIDEAEELAKQSAPMTVPTPIVAKSEPASISPPLIFNSAIAPKDIVDPKSLIEITHFLAPPSLIVDPKTQVRKKQIDAPKSRVNRHHLHNKKISSIPNKSNVISIQDTKVDLKFIDRMEGTLLRGYVPLPKTSQSGVTVGSGFDLGQVSLSEFNQLPLSSSLKAKLKPYVGLKRYQAVDYLKSHPLKIDSVELVEVNRVAANKILVPLVKRYNATSKVNFYALPSAAQTALFSFAYQYGSGFMYKPGTKALWNYYTKQDWKDVNKTLLSFRSYSPRRRQEAQLIHRLV